MNALSVGICKQFLPARNNHSIRVIVLNIIVINFKSQFNLVFTILVINIISNAIFREDDSVTVMLKSLNLMRLIY